MNVQLLELRLKAGMSITDLAEASGVPDHVIRWAEKGGTPRPGNALKLANTFGVPVLDLWPIETGASAA